MISNAFRDIKQALRTTFICATALFPALGSADAMVWEASNKHGKVLLGGTFHMLKITDYPLNKEYDLAYEKADTLYFETDTSKMLSLEGQQLMMKLMSQPPGETLQTELSPKAFSQLKALVESKGHNISHFQNFRAAMVLLTLMSAELAQMGVTPTSGVEVYFTHKAKTDGKPIYGLESMEEHFKILANLGKGHEDEMIEQSAGDLKELRTDFDKLVKAWKSADLKTMEDKFIAEMKAYPKIYDSLLVKRNKDWVTSIDQLVKTKELEYVLVGAAHLVGEDSVLAMLEKKGYKIKRFELPKAKKAN